MKLYSVFLPLNYNDGRKIREELFLKTKEELLKKFGATSITPHILPPIIDGYWMYKK